MRLQTKVSKTNGPSELSGRTRIHKLEEQALRNYWTIETDRGGRRTAIPRMDHTTGAAKIQKQTVCSDWRGLISTQKIEMETLKNKAQLKKTREGTEENTCGRQIEVTLGFVYHFT